MATKQTCQGSTDPVIPGENGMCVFMRASEALQLRTASTRYPVSGKVPDT